MNEDSLAFVIEGPDEDGFVWICDPNGRERWCRNLGQKESVAQAFSQWLASVDEGD